MKKHIGILLVICLLLSMLPVCATAEQFTYGDVAGLQFVGDFLMEITKGGEALYAITDEFGNPSTCSENDDWNIKFVYEGDMPTLTLRGAQIGKYNAEKGEFYQMSSHGITSYEPTKRFPLTIIVESDSAIEANRSGINCEGTKDDPWICDMTIRCVGDAKLSIFAGGRQPGIRSRDLSQYTLILDNANLDIVNTEEDTIAVGIQCGKLIINGGNLNLSSVMRCIESTSTVTFNGGNHTFTCNSESIFTSLYASESITINDGNIKMYKPLESGGGCINTGSLTINGGNVYGEGYNYAVKADTVEFNGGVVELKAISDAGDAQIFVEGAPDLANYQNPVAVLGVNAEDFAKYDIDNATDNEMGYFKLAANGSPDAPVIPSSDEPAPSETPDVSTAPDESKTPDETGAPNSDTPDNNSLLWVVIAAVVVAAAAAAFVILRKKKGACAE